MTGKKKHIKFTYFEVVSMVDDKEVLYDLEKWLYEITSLTLGERKKDINGVQGRLETIEMIEDDFYALNFMRMDEASDAYKAKENKKAKHIDLDADEYLGKNTVAVYDAKNHILLIQNNKGSYTPNAIQNYINMTNDGEICYFRPMINAFDVKRCNKGIIKRIIATCSAVNDFDTEGSADFERIINSCKNLGSQTFHIEIGIGRGKDKSLNNQSACEVLNTMLQNSNCLSTARVDIYDDEVAGVFDLFDNLQVGKFDLMIPERGELDFIKVAKNIYSVYKAKK